ncbi:MULTISPECIES: DUF6603 domain-containing protein [Saccharibacillus]|uniref:DUF6603 domain-containing protein n=1 Tax=Saccharibacillus TaxID=456492 RepID=UPI00123C217F|nr:DUF6603 domain-containing protein [Saccharibacillus sp. WB 17]MWJ30504.1 hypothetical protein [Saccharibacillus sp. WB 17]
MEDYDDESAPSLTVALSSKFQIKDALFQVVLLSGEAGTEVSGEWVNRDRSFELNDAAAYFDIVLPDFLNFDWRIAKIRLRYASSDSSLSFQAVIRDFGELRLESRKLPGRLPRRYELNLAFPRTLELSDLPIIGSFCDPGDGFRFESIALRYVPNVEVVFSLRSKLVIQGTTVPFDVDYVQSLKPPLPHVSSSALTGTTSLPAHTIHWLEIDKSFSVLYVSKIGFSLFESEIELYLDASFTIAMLRIDFYALRVSAPLKKLTDVRFGLGGLTVSVERPNFSLSGGLYQSPTDETLYNGSLGLRIGAYSFQALGSYGELPGSGEKSFFAYLMLGLPLGGPAFFFVTGLAFGFGVNRSIRLPDLQGVRAFPLVSAAMGDTSPLAPDTPPRQALGALSEFVVPESGQYFISAGLRFLTFGVLDSFILLNIEMGGRTVISLLGLSTASIPPKLADAHPIMRAELAIKAVFDPGQGVFMLTAALTDASFLFDPSCKLTGGFAIGFWFKGAYSGDFIVTLGGCHHPNFQNIHYPEIPPLGVSWIASDRVSVKGEAYFALTPACLMAGASLKLLFEWGNLKAWLFAAADFILQWKPFFYQARAQISVGVSYRISLFGIGKTFKVELGAGIKLWGPDFSAKVYVDWYIISFTIGFGAGSEQEPQAIGWDDFAASFLPGAFDADERTPKRMPTGFSAATASAPSPETSSEPASLSSIGVTDGLLDRYRDHNGRDAYVVDGFRAAFRIEQKVPCTRLAFNGRSLLNREYRLDLPPMKREHVRMDVDVNIRDAATGRLVEGMDAAAEYRNVPAALWGRNDGDRDLPLMPVGGSVSVRRFASPVHLLPERGAYEESALNARESITKHAVTRKPVFAPAVPYPTDRAAALEQIRRTIGASAERERLLTETAAAFGTWEQARIGTLASDPQAVLLAVPALRTTGSAAGTVQGCRPG